MEFARTIVGFMCGEFGEGACGMRAVRAGSRCVRDVDVFVVGIDARTVAAAAAVGATGRGWISPIS